MEFIVPAIGLWVMFAGTFAIIVPVLGYRLDKLRRFRTGIRACVTGSACAAPPRSSHHALEAMAWSIMKRDTLVRRVIAAYAIGFIAVALVPLEVMAKVLTGKRT